MALASQSTHHQSNDQLIMSTNWLTDWSANQTVNQKTHSICHKNSTWARQTEREREPARWTCWGKTRLETSNHVCHATDIHQAIDVSVRQPVGMATHSNPTSIVHAIARRHPCVQRPDQTVSADWSHRGMQQLTANLHDSHNKSLAKFRCTTNYAWGLSHRC